MAVPAKSAVGSRHTGTGAAAPGQLSMFRQATTAQAPACMRKKPGSVTKLLTACPAMGPFAAAVFSGCAPTGKGTHRPFTSALLAAVSGQVYTPPYSALSMAAVRSDGSGGSMTTCRAEKEHVTPGVTKPAERPQSAAPPPTGVTTTSVRDASSGARDVLFHTACADSKNTAGHRHWSRLVAPVSPTVVNRAPLSMEGHGVQASLPNVGLYVSSGHAAQMLASPAVSAREVPGGHAVSCTAPALAVMPTATDVADTGEPEASTRTLSVAKVTAAREWSRGSTVTMPVTPSGPEGAVTRRISAADDTGSA